MMKIFWLLATSILLVSCQAEPGSEPDPGDAMQTEAASISNREPVLLPPGNQFDMPSAAAEHSAPESLEPSSHEAPGMQLEGMFQYLADAPRFRDCRSGRSYPVAMSDQYIELERAYLNSGIKPGEELKVALHGRYLERPGMEENSREIHLIVDQFQGITETQDCAPPPLAELFNTYWKLISLNDSIVKPIADQKEAHLVLQEQDQRLAGSGGCNRFFGNYIHEDEKLSFSGLGSTMMACPEGMDTEQAFLLALGQTNRAVIRGEFLELFHDDKKLARLEAIYF